MSNRITIFLVFSTFLQVLGFKIHEYMTKREVQSVFNHDKDLIEELKYDVVFVFFKKYVKKKKFIDEIRIELKAFDENYICYLEERGGILWGWSTPIFVAKYDSSLNESDGSNIYYKKVSHPVTRPKVKFYHNRKRRSAISAFTDIYNKTHINGIIDDGIVLRSLPNGLTEKLLTNHSDLLLNKLNLTESYNSKHNVMTTIHIAINKKNHSFSHEVDRNYPNPKKEWTIGQEKIDTPQRECGIPLQKKRPRDAIENPMVSTVYPEILVVVDYETFRNHDKNYEMVATYVAAFWNAVDLIYREMKNPEMRLNIAGIVIIEDLKAQPYIESDPKDSTVLLGRRTVENVGHYFYQQITEKLCNFDVVVGMTQRSLKKNGNVETLGMAFVSAACMGSYSATVIKDVGFMGIGTAAHELGHLFGASHDGDAKSPSCSPKGYIMSNGLVEKTNHWSECSIKAIQENIRNYGNCLTNKPDIIISHLKKLPGKVLTRDEQCNRQFPGYYSADNDCKFLTCKYCTIPYIWCYEGTWKEPPAEGSSCGHKKFCLNATCIDDPGWYDE